MAINSEKGSKLFLESSCDSKGFPQIILLLAEISSQEKTIRKKFLSACQRKDECKKEMEMFLHQKFLQSLIFL